MADIVINKLDEVYLKVLCEPSIAHELNAHFSFEAPGAKFHPLYRSKKWDGRIRLYHLLSQTIYVGLKDYIKHFAEVNQYTVEDNSTQVSDRLSIDECTRFIKALDLSLPNNDAIRDYQQEAVYRAITEARRLFLSPTGSGKSLIIYCLIRWHLLNKRRQLIIVPNTSLVEQMYSDFQSYSQNNGWKASYNCYRIYGAVDKNSDMPIVISTWQSLYKLPKTYFQSFDVIYGDEAHLFQAKSLTGIMNKCVNSPFRIATTGTLDGSKVNKLVLEGLFGPVYRTTTTKELIDSNKLAELKIFAIVLQYSDQVKKDCKALKYREELDFLVQMNERNKFIRNLALDQKGNTLVLFQLVEKQGKLLYDMIQNKVDERKIFFVYGGTDTQQREDIRKITEIETDAIIVGSYGCMSTGINIRNLHNIIFASPSKSRIRNLQSIGRGLRIGENKQQCKLYDIGDDLTWKTRKNYTLYHMMERIKIYADEEFDYSFIRVPISA